MASIRRTLSPYHDHRPYHNGANAFSPPKFASNTNFSSPPSRFFLSLRRFLDADFLRRSSRKGHHRWKRSFYACFLFFFLGFLFGVMPIGQVDVVQNHDFSFANIRPPVEATTTTIVKEFIVDRVTVSQPENFVVDKVELAVDGRLKLNDRYDFIPRKQLIVITPTYNRAMQAYFLNRMIQVLRLVPPPLVWIVVEMNSQSVETAEILRHSGVMYRHLVSLQNMTNIKDRGVHQRNRALEHIQLHKLDGIVYFADDDNIYSLELFERLRGISRFGTWPVAMLEQGKNKAMLEGPVCSNVSKVIGWHTNEKSRRLRRFHVDMSGFGFNSTILWDPKRWKRSNSKPIRQLDTVKEGFQETTFIEQLVEDERQMEGLGGCWRILNWHLHLATGGGGLVGYPKGWQLWKNLDVIIPAQRE